MRWLFTTGSTWGWFDNDVQLLVAWCRITAALTRTPVALSAGLRHNIDSSDSKLASGELYG